MISVPSVRQREIELAMREIPEAIRAIRETAIGEVFAKELDQMDEANREVLNKIISYMEKKYISVPMKLARKVILENAVKIESNHKNRYQRQRFGLVASPIYSRITPQPGVCF